jgi:hypothetical protein
MKAKQTAVEWLYENLLDNPLSNEDIIYNISVFEEAKEMEKEQIIDAYIKGNYKSNRDMYWKVKSAEQYCNEKYNTK